MRNLIALLLYVLISAVLMIVSATAPAVILLTVSSGFAAWLIWRLVRHINRRDDPRVEPPAPNPAARQDSS